MLRSIALLLVCQLPMLAFGQQHFPDRCVGTWEGTMHIWARGAVRDSVPIRLTIARQNDSTWTWRTDYLSTRQPMTKDYLLRLVDAATQRYATDERDGILLDGWVYGNKLYEVFETGPILLTSTYDLQAPNRMVFEVTAGSKQDVRVEVTSHPVTSVQRAVLQRVW